MDRQPCIFREARARARSLHARSAASSTLEACHRGNIGDHDAHTDLGGVPLELWRSCW